MEISTLMFETYNVCYPVFVCSYKLIHTMIRAEVIMTIAHISMGGYMNTTNTHAHYIYIYRMAAGLVIS